MNKAVLKDFAIESRKDLIDRIKIKLNLYYADEDFNTKINGDMYLLENDKHILNLTKEEKQKRDLLVGRIKEIGIERVIEESAYTWFNRIIAIRYMEIHDFLPLGKNNESLGIRVLSSNDNTPNPEILKFSNLINNQLDINFNQNYYSSINNDNEKFKYIIQLVCNKLKKVFPDVFGGLTDYIDLLIPENLLSETGFVAKLISKLDESDFDDVEIIGWLYQYYNQTEKDRVISAKKAYKKHEIAYATQLFTPDWIVKYMVENSLGKYCFERNIGTSIKDTFKYYVGNHDNYKERKKLTDIKFIDPCCGSGHILVYAFTTFYKIYEAEGYLKQEIPELILRYNLFGLDVDDRAGQLSILSLLLKAREYDKQIFNKSIVSELNVMSIKESNILDNYAVDTLPDSIKDKALYLKETLINAKEIGSLLKVYENDYSSLLNFINSNNTLETQLLAEPIKLLVKEINILSQKYELVVTNPPYMSQSNMSSKLKEYVTKHYSDYKADLFSAFIVQNKDLCTFDGYMGFLTPFVWMFISSYEKLRDMILSNCNITSIVQLEYNSFEAACVPVVSFILKNSHKDSYIGNYVRLSDFPGAAIQEEKYLEAINNKTYYYYETNLKKMSDIPKKPIAYWLSDDFLKNFEEKKVSDYASVVTGMTTADNNRFLRKWWEVDYNKIAFNCENTNNNFKWYPYQKGGEYRKWFGNNEFVVNWENNGFEIKNFKDEITGKVRSSSYNDNYILHEGLSWTYLSNSCFGIRYVPKGFLFDNKGSMVFCEDNLYYILGFLCTKYAHEILDLLNPTMSFQPGDIASVPIKLSDKKSLIENIVKENIEIEKNEWDSFETSWDFKKSPILKKGLIEENINDSILLEKQKYDLLKANEEKLNMYYNEIYNISHEIDSSVDDKDITYKIKSTEEYVKDLISYFVGCAFGRYSLKKDRIISDIIINDNNYELFMPDEDNIIPISDDENIYFDDDIVGQFKKFIKKVYGEENYSQNITYISSCLNRKGTEKPEDTIRRYFISDFYSDHLRKYDKRPIYWMITSGKKNGFKALIYIHRYNKTLLSKLRVDYLHKTQDTYKRLLDDCNYKLNNDNLSPLDRKYYQNSLNVINLKIDECSQFDEKIGHLANQMININIDDGVKSNYEKFAEILEKIK